jgi:hypothetical protein
MPRISQFYGISIYMYYGDHAPPHLHAIYGDSEAVVDIQTGAVIAGDLPRRARKLVDEWASAHRAELLENWERATSQRPLLPIDPLD